VAEAREIVARSEEEEEEGVEESDEKEREAIATTVVAGRALFSRIKSSFCYKICFALL
jgi:hypothetical protein